MTPLLQKKRIVVTGASRGIGRAIALAAAREGADVGVGYRTGRTEADAVVAEIREKFGRESLAIGFDVTNEREIEAAFSAFCARFGGLDGLVNNAGVSLPGLLVTLDADRIRRAIDVDLVGPLLCSRAAISRMLEHRSGVIANLSSVAAVRPSRGQSAYAAAKAGVEALTRALALEYAKKGIRVVGVRPGAVDTEMLASTRALAEKEMLERIPAGRIASAAEIAETVVFLLSDRASYVSGDTIAVDGGYGVG
jgi:3-oxoacyl-[acyl-carrier protein] reductase